MKSIIVDLIAKETNLKIKEIENLVELPPSDKLGDYTFPCFILSKKPSTSQCAPSAVGTKSPLIIAKELAKKLRKNLPKEISNVDFKGPYVNFFINKKLLAKNVLTKVEKENFGKLKIYRKKIGIEYPSPNTNKSLHVGHLRNIAIGESICKIINNAGNKIIHLNLFNDRGILISKSMVGYEKFADGKTPKSEAIKGDKFVGNLYTKFSKASVNNKKFEELAQKKLKLWEKNDKETLDLWKKLNSWTYSGMQETFQKFGLSKIDKSYYESEIYKKGKELIEAGLKNKVFYKKKDGAIAIDLEKEKLGEKILLRSDGTSVYITQDLYLAEQKIKDFNLDSSYYIVGCDQEYHFKVLFSILDKLGLKKDWKHLSYGMVSLPTGKMKSREGTAVSADDLINETQEIAKKGIKDRNIDKLSERELEERSLKIALSAIKYSLLKVDIHRGIIFNPDEALAFEGNTGPYLLYSYARASSIIRKVKSKKLIKIIDLKDSEIKLLKKINSFEETITTAYQNLAPNIIANYAFELSQMFNEFYHSCPVLGSIEEGFRLKLVDAFRITLKKSLDLLGIDVLEEM
ncbi:MAG: arginine--tRNA ligase [Nanoarchaeota archaeon]|nr:arginine--tRNA ligase [Nanoarchaeota archaeon]